MDVIMGDIPFLVNQKEEHLLHKPPVVYNIDLLHSRGGSHTANKMCKFYPTLAGVSHRLRIFRKCLTTNEI